MKNIIKRNIICASVILSLMGAGGVFAAKKNAGESIGAASHDVADATKKAGKAVGNESKSLWKKTSKATKSFFSDVKKGFKASDDK